MHRRALHSAAETTRRAAADGRQHPDGQTPTLVESDGRTAPNALNLPASPTPDRGLVPSGTSVTTVDGAPLSAVRSQRFAAVTVCHDVRLTDTDDGVRLTATLTNHGDEPWGYRVPRGPAPFAGGRSTLAVSALGTENARFPEGEYAFLQPLTVWTDEVAYGYNWQVTLCR